MRRGCARRHAVSTRVLPAARSPWSGPGTLTLTVRGEAPAQHELRYEQPTPETPVLTGAIPPGAAEIRPRKVDLERTELMARGLRWISERPYNLCDMF